MNAGKSERASKAWMDSVRMIGSRLTQEDVQAWVTNYEFNISQQEIILSINSNICPEIISTQLLPFIKDVLEQHGLLANVKIQHDISTTLPSGEAQLAKKIIDIWGSEYQYIGNVEIPDLGLFVLLKTSINKAKQDMSGVMILELDTDDISKISEYSFAIVDAEIIPEVFEAYCRKYHGEA